MKKPLNFIFKILKNKVVQQLRIIKRATLGRIRFSNNPTATGSRSDEVAMMKILASWYISVSISFSIFSEFSLVLLLEFRTVGIYNYHTMCLIHIVIFW